MSIDASQSANIVDLGVEILTDTHKIRKTYLCHVVSGQAAPGYEPEEDAAAIYAITEVAQFELQSEEKWEASIFDNHIAYPYCRKYGERWAMCKGLS